MAQCAERTGELRADCLAMLVLAIRLAYEAFIRLAKPLFMCQGCMNKTAWQLQACMLSSTCWLLSAQNEF